MNLFRKAVFVVSALVIISFTGSSCFLSQNNLEQSASGTIETASTNAGTKEEQIGQNGEGPAEDFEYTGHSKNIIFGISYKITAEEDTGKIVFTSTLPPDYKYRQDVIEHSFSIEPSEIYTINENTYAKFIINDPLEVFYIDIDTEMEIYDFDLNMVLENRERLSDIEIVLDNPDRYLKSEPSIEANDETIEEIASTFSATGRLSQVEEIYNYVLDSMTYYGYDPDNVGAAQAVSAGGGDCTEYSDLFVALCRARGIPARVVEGYVVDSGPDELSLGHNWSEIYFEELGWIPFDTIYDDNNGDSRETTFNNLKNIYVYTSFIRNDPELFDFHYYAYIYYGDNIEVIKEVSVLSI